MSYPRCASSLSAPTYYCINLTPAIIKDGRPPSFPLPTFAAGGIPPQGVPIGILKCTVRPITRAQYWQNRLLLNQLPAAANSGSFFSLANSNAESRVIFFYSWFSRIQPPIFISSPSALIFPQQNSRFILNNVGLFLKTIHAMTSSFIHS